MRKDRDLNILILTMIPVGLGIYMFFTWQATGQLPFDLSHVPLPNLSLPGVPAWNAVLPSPMVDLINHIKSSGPLIFLSIAVGALIGVIVMGTLADIAHAMAISLRSLRRRNSRRPSWP